MKLYNFLFKQSIFNQLMIIRTIFYRIKMKCWYGFFVKKSGKGCVIIKPIKLTPEFITLGNGVYIANNGRVEGVSFYMGVKYSPSILLEDRVSVQQNLHLTCAGSIEIGKDTAIAANVSITDIDHPYTDILIAPEYQQLIVDPVVIGAACKIYNNAVILPGVKLGTHCVVGANAVVRKGHYPDYSIIAGNPAKVVKRFDANSNSWKPTNPDGTFSTSH